MFSPAMASTNGRRASERARKHSFEWGPKSLVRAPAQWPAISTSTRRGRERCAALASVNNLCLPAQSLPQRGIRLRQTRSEFPERQGAADALSAARKAEFVPVRAPAANMWGDELHP